MSKDYFAVFKEGYRHVLRIEGENISFSFQNKVKQYVSDEEIFVYDC